MKEYFPINRRGILSTLCTGTLTLLAPVVARAKPHRKVRFWSYGVKGIILGPAVDHMQDNWVWDSFDPRSRKTEFADLTKYENIIRCTEWSSNSFPEGSISDRKD